MFSFCVIHESLTLKIEYFFLFFFMNFDFDFSTKTTTKRVIKNAKNLRVRKQINTNSIKHNKKCKILKKEC